MFPLNRNGLRRGGSAEERVVRAIMIKTYDSASDIVSRHGNKLVPSHLAKLVVDIVYIMDISRSHLAKLVVDIVYIIRSYLAKLVVDIVYITN